MWLSAAGIQKHLPILVWEGLVASVEVNRDSSQCEVEGVIEFRGSRIIRGAYGCGMAFPQVTASPKLILQININ
jgi:hypothetical protein